MIYLAIDFGGGSGRVIAGKLENGKLEMELIHRFPNRQVKLGNHVYWDFLALFEDMKTGLKMAGAKGLKVDGIAIDTWGVDFGLIDKDGNLLGNPICYRDARTKGMPEEVFKQIDPSAHYAINGTQVMEINTLFQLYSMKKADSPQLEKAAHLLFTPDLFSYYLTGEANNEYTIASTSELLNASNKDWDWETIDQLGLPRHIFGKIVMPGAVRGKLCRDIAEETGLGEVDVIAVGSHDTASAVAAVPATEDEYPMAFISSGTWSLLGVEIEKPILTEEARKAEFTNEGGIGGRITFLQNITGLWIMQRLMAEWKENGEEQQFDIILPQAEEAHINAFIPVMMQHSNTLQTCSKPSSTTALPISCRFLRPRQRSYAAFSSHWHPNMPRLRLTSTRCCHNLSRVCTLSVAVHRTNYSTVLLLKHWEFLSLRGLSRQPAWATS